jgi:hypothetical protein
VKLRQYIKAREALVRQAERQFEDRIIKALNKSVEPVLKEMEKGNFKKSIVNKAQIKPIEDAYKWLYITWGSKFGRWFINNFTIRGKKELFEDEMSVIFTTKAAKKVKLMYGTTKELLEPAIQDALKLANEGASIPKIMKEIRANITDVGGAISKGRATTIARTEVIGASNTASYVSAKSTDLELEKAWITGGANIRDTHYAAEAQGWIAMDEKFDVGSYQMEYPGDPTGGPEEVINCKCTVIYRTKD